MLLDERHPREAGPPTDGEASWSYRAVFDHLRRDLLAMWERLSVARDQHVRMLVRVAALRRRSQELAAQLYQRLVAARRILGGAFDPDRSFELAAMAGKTPRVPSDLEEQVDQTVKILREPEVDPGTVEADGVEIDLGRMADGLEGRLEERREVEEERRRARKALGETKVVKDQAIAYCKGLLPGVAQTLEGYFRIVGEHELADRIRTSRRRVTRRQGEAESETEDTAPPATEPAEPTATTTTS